MKMQICLPGDPRVPTAEIVAMNGWMPGKLKRQQDDRRPSTLVLFFKDFED